MARVGVPGVTPADRCVTLYLIDPAGHRLVRSGRDLDQRDPEQVWWDRSTIGANVTMEYELEDDEDPEGRWKSLHFDCKACRGSGAPMASFVLVADVVSELARVWAEGHDAPRHERFSTVTEQ
jgi:hypothetical protein